MPRRLLSRLVLWAMLGTAPGAVMAQALTGAAYAEPTTRYDHGVLGDAVEWGALRLSREGAPDVLIRLPESRVFEDLAPRLVDLGAHRAAMVVESDLERGARLALYTAEGLFAATPFIGQPNRWLAPVGAADLDGDGQVELAYVDRPHLAKRLRIWRLVPGTQTLREVASAGDLTNHRIGWDHIEGGLRDCGDGPEMVLASGDWARVIVARLRGGEITRETLGPYDEAAMARALGCR
ncbi:VCBS repeat-containing protein [Salipiger bermudensis]|uniref:VCBS repeat-containing protein n=1 Tax=Salipiger bermudensis TaxID=344736 RepID=UPI001CD4A59D|nr:VCBS repeat-containing protein [Salipiger bermudensis]MCA0961337.1 VCBS repeat-containing protein [Salipiger bermudensis]